MFKRDTWVVIGQLFIIVILALVFSMTSFTPINASGMEGFQTQTSLEYTAVNQPNSSMDDVFSMSTDTSACKKVDGFGSLFCSPTAPAEKLDIYSQAKGDLNCESLGLYNSKGPLCLDENMKRMLSTRGANAVGGFGQIGSP